MHRQLSLQGQMQIVEDFIEIAFGRSLTGQLPEKGFGLACAGGQDLATYRAGPFHHYLQAGRGKELQYRVAQGSLGGGGLRRQQQMGDDKVGGIG